MLVRHVSVVTVTNIFFSPNTENHLAFYHCNKQTIKEERQTLRSTITGLIPLINRYAF